MPTAGVEVTCSYYLHFLHPLYLRVKMSRDPSATAFSLRVDEDQRTRPSPTGRPPVFLNVKRESPHGIEYRIALKPDVYQLPYGYNGDMGRPRWFSSGPQVHQLRSESSPDIVSLMSTNCKV